MLYMQSYNNTKGSECSGQVAYFGPFGQTRLQHLCSQSEVSGEAASPSRSRNFAAPDSPSGCTSSTWQPARQKQLQSALNECLSVPDLFASHMARCEGLGARQRYTLHIISVNFQDLFPYCGLTRIFSM